MVIFKINISNTLPGNQSASNILQTGFLLLFFFCERFYIFRNKERNEFHFIIKRMNNGIDSYS